MTSYISPEIKSKISDLMDRTTIEDLRELVYSGSIAIPTSLPSAWHLEHFGKGLSWDTLPQAKERADGAANNLSGTYDSNGKAVDANELTIEYDGPVAPSTTSLTATLHIKRGSMATKEDPSWKLEYLELPTVPVPDPGSRLASLAVEFLGPYAGSTSAGTDYWINAAGQRTEGPLDMELGKTAQRIHHEQISAALFGDDRNSMTATAAKELLTKLSEGLKGADTMILYETHVIDLKDHSVHPHGPILAPNKNKARDQALVWLVGDPGLNAKIFDGDIEHYHIVVVEVASGIPDKITNE